MGAVLRVCTSGSVDDGKSTLVGRLLFDSRALFEDQVAAVRRLTRRASAAAADDGDHSSAGIDFALFTDGLRAEREQGITIDVAYRYFQTARRKFVLADTPGHDRYTRNMATGASTSDVAILLADARHGLRPQSERHARIGLLFGIQHFVVAVNKMDLVGFSQERFVAVERQFGTLLAHASVTAIPVCATDGDNVVQPSTRMPWYTGRTLLAALEETDASRTGAEPPLRLAVQLAVRGPQGFRGYAGRIASGRLRVGDRVTVWPSCVETTVGRILVSRADVESAAAPESVTLVLNGDHDVARGDVIGTGRVRIERRFAADLVWMDERALDPRRTYLLRLGTQRVRATIDGPALALNDIARVEVVTREPVVLNGDPNVAVRTGFILIDPETGATAAGGVVPAALATIEGTAARRTLLQRAFGAARAAFDRSLVRALERAQPIS